MKKKLLPPDWTSVHERVRQTLEAEEMLCNVDSVVLALSGGKDSVCLFHVLRSLLPLYGVRFLCAHVNHGLRGERAADDERFCAALAAEYGVEYRAFSCDVLTFCREQSLSVEEAARKLRYRLLLDFAREHRAVLATAHTASDQTETVLMQISRGGGMRAACGIEKKRADGIIRPLISLTSQEIVSFCHEQGYAFVTDETNSDLSLLRNFYRQRIVQPMRENNPNLDACVARFSDIARQEHMAFLALAQEKLQESALYPVRTRLPLAPIVALLQKPYGSAVLYDLFSEMLLMAGKPTPPESVHFQAICRFLSTHVRPGAVLEVSEGYGFLVEQESLFATALKKESRKSVPLDSGENYAEGNVLLLKTQKKCPACLKVHKMHTSAYLDCDKIKGALFVRRRIAGDTYTVGGKTRKVKDLFSSRGFAQGMREEFPLICDHEGIVWIPGELAADRVRAEVGAPSLLLELKSGPLYEELVKRRQYE